MPDMKQHWEQVFEDKKTEEVSWFQPYPKTSVAFLEYFHLPFNANIIDVGAGDSRLADVLIQKGYQNIYVLDISAVALNKAKARLGADAAKVHWIVSDITEFVPPVHFDFWHDRAAFHFLTTEEKIDQYVQLAEHNIKPGGYMVLGTFSENGPTKCSGLDIKQYNEASMSSRFERSFNRIKCITEQHETPSHTLQNFLFCSFRRK